MSDEELEAIRRRKLSQYQQRATDEQKQAQAEKEIEDQKEALLRKILSPEARQRLTNIKMVKREFTEQLELQLIQLAQLGKIPIPLSDDQLKQILIQLQPKKRDIKITRI